MSSRAPRPQTRRPAGTPVVEPGVEGALADFAGSLEAQRLARLEADQELLLTLQLHRFAGPEWDAFVRELARYATSVLRAWIRGRAIFRHLSSKRVPWVRTTIEPTDEEALDMTIDVIVEAIPVFRDRVLLGGVWDPSRGATIKTFFIGQCLFRFPNVYRAWLTKRQNEDRAQRELVFENVHSVVKPAPEAMVELSTELARTDPRNPAHRERWIRVRREMGYEYAEIGSELGISERAVEGAVYRMERRWAR